MSLMDAPVYDAARARRNQKIVWSAVAAVFVLLVIFWFAAGRPIDWPWNWANHMLGRSTANSFLTAVEKNDLETAYGIWTHDKDWKQHPDQHKVYPFSRFEGDWSSTSPDNEYGNIQSHRIAAARIYGNQLLMAILINGRKSKALSLDYDPPSHTLSFALPGVEIDPESYSH
jgi:hypothetical protein